MHSSFEILAAFLERFGEEVEGRALAEPSTELQARLARLARGTLPAREQKEIFDLLNKNPQWVAWLAGEVKALRGAT